VSDADARAAFLVGLVAESGGRVRFDRWMDAALFHPEFGYYMSGTAGIGARGDFSTWPGMEATLAAGVASWLRRHRPPAGPWQAIEVGGGDGALAARVTRRVGWWRRPRLNLVEVSPKLEALQRRMLRGRAVAWDRDVRDALEASGGHALLFANELVDAFPCRIFRRAAGAWIEMHVAIEGGRAAGCWCEPDGPLPRSTALAGDWPEGGRVAVHESFPVWLHRWRPAWCGGRMLVIDYGETCADLRSGKPGGTLRAFARQQRFEGRDVLDGFGRRDLTADVNFSDFALWCDDLDLWHTPPVTLGDFLGRMTGRGPDPRFRDAAAAFKVIEFGPRDAAEPVRQAGS
jgi:SAM-dependent MidA family methyltransferase